MLTVSDTACKTNNGETVEPLNVLYALRAHIAEEGRSLPAHVAMIANLKREGNPAGHPRADRSRWCEGLGIKNALTDKVDVLLHVGCENAFDQVLWPELHAIAHLLQAAGVDFGIAYEPGNGDGRSGLRPRLPERREAINPADGRPIAQFPLANKAQLMKRLPRLPAPSVRGATRRLPSGSRHGLS